jgi:hypothetical protein
MENEVRKPGQKQFTTQEPKIPFIFPRWMGEYERAASIIGAAIVLAAAILAVVLNIGFDKLR